jgi:hypothetical protein
MLMVKSKNFGPKEFTLGVFWDSLTCTLRVPVLNINGSFRALHQLRQDENLNSEAVLLTREEMTYLVKHNVFLKDNFREECWVL